MKIQVLGSGCPSCKKLYEMTKEAVLEMGDNVTVDYLGGPEGIKKMLEMGAMSSPLLVLDGKIVMVGFTPDLEKIKQTIQKFAEDK